MVRSDRLLAVLLLLPGLAPAQEGSQGASPPAAAPVAEAAAAAAQAAPAPPSREPPGGGSYPPLFSSVRTSFATALSVSKTPTPVGATAWNSGTLRGLMSRCSSSTVAMLGRSRLLYCTT